MPGPEAPPAEPPIEDFLGEPTRDLDAWYRLWDLDRRLPLRRDPGWLGGLKYRLKRAIRKLVHGSEQDLWERQRLYNLVLYYHLEPLLAEMRELAESVGALGRDVQKVQSELFRDLKEMQKDYLRDREAMTERVEHLEKFLQAGLADVMRHNDALFARVDQKLDRLRRRGPEPRGPA